MNNKYLDNKTELNELPRVSDRISFVYLEHAKINRHDGAITVADSRGVIKIPSAVMNVIFLGPGTDITHRAIELIGDTGNTVIWVGEKGVRFYANGRPLSNSTRLLEIQAKKVSNKQARLEVARKMYQLRFPGEEVDHLTMQQLRGREGARVRRIYRENAKKYNVKWDRREYNPQDYGSGTIVNQALSTANVCLYGLVQSVISSFGLSPGLGFVHTGHVRSFVYDIADLYKSEKTIPLAFEIASVHKDGEDIGQTTRLAMRKYFYEDRLISRIVSDIQYLLGVEEAEKIEIETLNLWDDKEKLVNYGVNYSRYEG